MVDFFKAPNRTYKNVNGLRSPLKTTNPKDFLAIVYVIYISVYTIFKRHN